MSPKVHENELLRYKADLSFQRRLNFIQAVAMVCVVLLLGWVVIRERTIVVPPEVKRPYEIGVSFTNAEYLADMAAYVLEMTQTTTPDSVEAHNKIILKMAHPAGYAELKTSLDAAAIRVKNLGMTTIWEARDEKVFQNDLAVQVSGRKKNFISDKFTSSQEKVFEVKFSLTKSGRLYVQHIKEIVKPGNSNQPLDE